MKINKIVKTDLLIYAGLFFIAFFVCLKSCLVPWARGNIGADTSVFLTISSGIVKGLAPFHNFFDNKGPLTYLISAPGMFFYNLYGTFSGVWITELILMFATIVFAYKTALFFADKFTAFLGTVFSFFILQSFFNDTAGSGEYSLLFITASLYIFAKYYFSQKELKDIELLLLGFFFAILVLIRINMFSLHLVFCLIILIELIVKHQFASLLKWAAMFILGICIAVVPVFLYLYFNNALHDYILQNIVYGSERAFLGVSIKESAKSFFVIIGKYYCFIPLFISPLWIFKYRKTKTIGFYAAYTLSYFFSVLSQAVIRENYDHYNIPIIPFIVPSVTFIIYNVSSYLQNVNKTKCKNIFIAFWMCIVLSNQILKFIDDVFSHDTDNTRNELISLGKDIENATDKDDKIISLGYSCQIYLFVNRKPASRYIYQISGVDFYPQAKVEFVDSILKNKPKIISVSKKDGQYKALEQWYAWYSPVFELIENDYTLFRETDAYFVFIKTQVI